MKDVFIKIGILMLLVSSCGNDFLFNNPLDPRFESSDESTSGEDGNGSNGSSETAGTLPIVTNDDGDTIPGKRVTIIETYEFDDFSPTDMAIDFNNLLLYVTYDTSNLYKTTLGETNLTQIPTPLFHCHGIAFQEDALWCLYSSSIGQLDEINEDVSWISIVNAEDCRPEARLYNLFSDGSYFWSYCTDYLGHTYTYYKFDDLTLISSIEMSYQLVGTSTDNNIFILTEDDLSNPLVCIYNLDTSEYSSYFKASSVGGEYVKEIIYDGNQYYYILGGFFGYNSQSKIYKVTLE